MNKKEDIKTEHKEEVVSENVQNKEVEQETTHTETSENEPDVREKETEQPEVKTEQTDEISDSDKQEDQQEANNQEVEPEETNPLEEAQLKLAALNDKYMRLSAEFDNYRKRTLKEKMELTKTANATMLVDILPVMDNFERAMASLENAKDLEAVKAGINLIYSRFAEFLKQKGVKEIEAKEQNLDTDLHEAITKIPAPTEALKGKIVDVVEKGYMLNDKVIRFAKVVMGE